MKKILIIRSSSIGDVLQTLSVVDKLKSEFPKSEIHFATQDRFIEFFKDQPQVTKIWSVPKTSGVRVLAKLAKDMSQESFTHVYDAHNNLRSFLLVLMLKAYSRSFLFIRRPVYRWKRFLLFRFRKNLFPKPFSGQLDQIRPLSKWGVSVEVPKSASLHLTDEVCAHVQAKYKSVLSKEFIALAPSAAYMLKRWPLEYWRELILLEANKQFVLLGGPEDEFLEGLAQVAPDRVLNLAGRLSLMESAAVVSLSEVLISNDTGVMHMAEQLNHPCIALMGPAPFGFPSKPSTRVLERNLPCRPCSKHGQGPCINPNFHECLRDISPQEVHHNLKDIMK